VLLILLLATPFVLLFLPAHFFDSGESMCLSVQIFNMKCLGCGLTRAIMHLIHFDFRAAWEFNKLSYIVFPFLVIFWIYLYGKLRNKKYFTFIDKLY